MDGGLGISHRYDSSRLLIPCISKTGINGTQATDPSVCQKRQCVGGKHYS
jgi:hypothetical protein